MTLVARVTFLVLVGATFSAFFVAQRLKSTAAGHRGAQDHALLLAQRRRQARHERHLDPAAGAPTTPPSTSSTSTATASSGWPRTCAMQPYRPLRLCWDGSADGGGRAPGRPIPPARHAARRGPLGDRPEDDDRRHQGAALRGLHRVQVHRSTKRMGNVDLPGRPQGADLHPRRLALPRRTSGALPHRPGQAARGRGAAELPGRAQPARVGRARWTASRCRSRDLPRAGAGARHGRQRRRHAGRVRGRRDPRAARA